jgi:hypothetical protein
LGCKTILKYAYDLDRFDTRFTHERRCVTTDCRPCISRTQHYVSPALRLSPLPFVSRATIMRRVSYSGTISCRDGGMQISDRDGQSKDASGSPTASLEPASKVIARRARMPSCCEFCHGGHDKYRGWTLEMGFCECGAGGGHCHCSLVQIGANIQFLPAVAFGVRTTFFKTWTGCNVMCAYIHGIESAGI